MRFANVLLILAAGLGLASGQFPAQGAIPRKQPPAGCVVVRKLGKQPGDHVSLSEALSSLGTQNTGPACIFVWPGTYHEQLLVDYKGPLTIYGFTEDARSYHNNTVTIWNNPGPMYPNQVLSTATIIANTSSFSIHNIVVFNTNEDPYSALAIAAIGDKQGYYGMEFRGRTNTLFANGGDQYYSNCFIQGTYDYIMGNAAAWFEHCTIASSAPGYITASSRGSDTDPGWFVFNRSRVIAYNANVPAASVWLGRPLGKESRVTFQNSDISNVVLPLGWDTWVTDAKPKFYEFNNTGDGSDTSGRQLLSPSNAAVTQAQIWPQSGTDWYDKSY